MKKNLRIRTVIILGITLLAIYAVIMPHNRLPNASDFTSLAALKTNMSNNIHLGLDLKGGIHLVMQVQAEEAVAAHVKSNGEQATKLLGDKGIAPAGDPQIDTATHTIVVKVADAGRANEASDELLKDYNANTIQGKGWSSTVNGDTITLTLSNEEARRIRESAHTQAMNIVHNRIDQFGVAEPIVTPHGAKDDYQILLQLPGVDDPERVKKVLQAESNLELRMVVGDIRSQVYPTKEAAMAAPGFNATDDEVLVYSPRDTEAEQSTTPGAPPIQMPVRYAPIEKKVIVRGQDLRDAVAVPDQFNSTNYEITFTLKPAGAEKFGTWTEANIGKDLAIVLNGEVRSAPRIQGKISDRGQITGKFTKQDAEDLALTLRSGALPARIVYLEERTVGPSLGADSIRQGLISSVAGLTVVCLFLLFYYRFSGVNAIVALILNLILLLAAIAWTGATLTLPGIAGVILLIGMAVDSNVLIFERIREELRNGKVVRSAVDTGFGKAFTTIMDTHVTTIVSAIFLFVFGTGPIRGFAVTLIAGLLANLFTAVFVSRTMFTWVLNRRGHPAETLSI
ncbi:MAG TPA: protein translocase subunit SecD [Blastocatellia bacterium]|nr:protein translocase subunit SecD [Blastocatellia bacterium]